MTDLESTNLSKLLMTFGTTSLGEGDITAGANLLATMAITLGNLAREGSGILTPEGRVIPVGCDLLATGSLISTMIRDEVVNPVGDCQNNLLAHLNRLLQDDKAEAARAKRGLARRWTIGRDAASSQEGSSLLNLMSGNPEQDLLICSREEEWEALLGAAPRECLADLVQRPRAFIPAASPNLLDNQLPGAHRGKALVTIGLNRAADVARFSELCPALMDGMIPAGPLGERVTGRLLITDPSRVLSMAAMEKGDKTTWLARLIWLADGNTGPEFPPEQQEKDRPVLPNLSARFQRAIHRVLANRFDSAKQEGIISRNDLAEGQAAWMEFLGEMERSLPGIQGTARHLLASLIFGLLQLVNAANLPEGFKFYRHGIEALARHLIRRMANARAEILFSSEEAGRIRKKRKILAKLDANRLDTRGIYRPLHLAADECRDLLFELMKEGQVKQHGQEWELVEETAPAEPTTDQMPLEV